LRVTNAQIERTSVGELFSQLGIDPKLLLAQGVNFLILLFVLTKFVYKPLMKMVEERRQKIELGVKGGEMAEQVIKKAENERVGIIKEADGKAIAIITEAEKTAQKKSQDIAVQADKKAQQTLKEAMLLAERKEKEGMEKVSAEAKKLVKEAIIKTVQLKPEQVDDKLIEEALGKI
jgi:F-type H+-transporting ATPase subunit b